jgi:hypothetical protein
MMSRRRVPIVALCAATAWLATAAASPKPREIALTIYNQDLALVRDRRAVDVAAGASEISFADVAAQIDPTSVHLRSAGGSAALRVMEQNYRYDLAGSDAVLTRHLDHAVEAVDKRGEVIRGTLLAQDAGNLVLRGTDGGEGVSIVSRTELARINFPRLPEGLITRPTLFWQVQAPQAGSQNLEIEYLTSGLSWHAEYVAAVAPSSDALTLSAWVSIQNQSGASYPDSRLKLIAGEVHRAQETPVPYLAKGRAAMAEDVSGFQEKAFFEYHLYTLERPATVSDKEIKQLTLFSPASVRATRGYEYDGARNDKDVAVVIKFKNSQKDGLGMALPAGKVRVYQEDSDGSLEFVGEDRIDHTPRDEEVRVGVGNAFDISAERAVVDMKRITDRVFEQTIEVKIRNHKKEAVTVKVIEHVYGTWEVVEKTHPFRKKDAYTLEFELPTAPDQEALLRYRVRVTS